MKYNKRIAFTASALGVMALGTSPLHAVDFTSSATVETTVTVTSVQDFDLGTLFASATGAANTDGVGALVISPAGAVTDPTDSATVQLINLGTPVPAQGSVSVAADFTLTLPDTSGIDAADFAADAGATLVADVTGNAIELVHESANPAVPSLYLMHFTVGDVSGGTVGTETATYDGGFPVTLDFGSSEYVFNIGGTVTTKPVAGPAASETYQAGVYSGTFEVTASY